MSKHAGSRGAAPLAVSSQVGRGWADSNKWMELRGEGKLDTHDKHAKLLEVKPTDDCRRLDN